MQRGPWHRTAGLFYGVGVHSGDRYDSFGEISRHELDGEECKAIKDVEPLQRRAMADLPRSDACRRSSV